MDPIDAGLARPWHALRLPEPLETRYRAEANPPPGRHLQSWLAILIVFNLLSLKIDLDLFGWETALVPIGLTLCVFMPVALAGLLALRGRPSALRQNLVVMAAGLTDMAIVLNSARIVPGGRCDDYLILAALLPLVLGLIAPLSFRYSLWHAGAAFTLYVGFVVGFDLTARSSSGIALLVACLILVPIKLGYTQEWAAKQTFLLGLRQQAQAAALRAANARLAALAVTDPLTGLANRRLFTERFDAAWASARAGGLWCGLVLIDIDRFKRINDSAGHAEGDRCLVLVAAALRGPAEAAGGLLARYGGEEFAVLLPHATAAAARGVAERLRAAVAALALVHPGLPPGGRVTVSLGVTAALGGDSAGEIEGCDLLRAADEALYAAKRNGRDRVESAAAVRACAA